MAKYNDVDKHGIIWWTERDCTLIKFNKGEAETDDLEKINKLKSLGYNSTTSLSEEQNEYVLYEDSIQKEDTENHVQIAEDKLKESDVDNLNTNKLEEPKEAKSNNKSSSKESKKK